jgi:hypothetical protein
MIIRPRLSNPMEEQRRGQQQPSPAPRRPEPVPEARGDKTRGFGSRLDCKATPRWSGFLLTQQLVGISTDQFLRAEMQTANPCKADHLSHNQSAYGKYEVLCTHLTLLICYWRPGAVLATPRSVVGPDQSQSAGVPGYGL